MKANWVDFKIYDLLRISGNDLPTELVAALKADYGHFAQSEVSTQAALQIKNINKLEIPAEHFTKRKSFMERNYTMQFEGKEYAVSLYKGIPDCVISLQAPYVLYFTKRKGCSNAVLDMLFTGVDIALRDTSGALLCKGAVVVRENQGIVLTGGSGAGKTSILIPLLNDGWSYLSDNTFILHKGKALCFRRHLVIHRYHLTTYHKILGDIAPEKPMQSMIKKGLALLLPYLPALLQNSRKINRLSDPYIRIMPEDLNFTCTEIQEPSIAVWICLSSADEFSIKELRTNEFVRRLQAILELIHIDYFLYRRLCAISGSYLPEQEITVLDDNIGNGKFYAVTLSPLIGFQEQYIKLKELFESTS
ncbi:hypothetical protein [Maridesulfovibrio sp.]|uniref:hypothetical protein n=1 Tax=Maridesulfovibrio sp. TaxID=2795000 RepID=UPI003BAB5254